MDAHVRHLAALSLFSHGLIAGLLAASLLLVGCAGSGATGDVAGPAATPVAGDLPAKAYVRNGQLLIGYGSGSNAAWLGAAWPGESGEAVGRHGHHEAVIDLLTEPPPSAVELERDWVPVSLHGSQEWQDFMSRLLRELAPVEPGSASLLSLREGDLLCIREQDGRARVVRATEVAPTPTIARVIGEDAFAALAGSDLQKRLAQAGEAEGPALFALPGDDLGTAFILFDFRSGQTVFVAQPPSPLPFDRKLGFSLRLLESLVLRSHLAALLRNPVSSANRLAWTGAQSGAALVPRQIPGPAGDPRPLATARAPMESAAWEAELDTRLGQPPLRGRMAPLIDGEAYFDALVKAIHGARESIDIQVYIFDSDDYALRIADLLKKRSREVRVRVIVDRLGSLVAGQAAPLSPYRARAHPPVSIADYLRRDSAVAVRALDNPWLTSDHTKVVVVDGHTAYLGGMNIGREYRYEWHDLMVEIGGPIVARLQDDFEQRWAAAGPGGDAAWALAAARPERPPATAGDPGNMAIRPLYTLAADPQILRTQVAAMRRAQARIFIEQPYIADDEVIAELIDARRRGVDVRVIVPTRNDSPLMHSANRIAANAFLRHGIRVFAYPGMTHVKAALYDNWAIVGSANLDKLSLRINRETDVATSDPAFVETLVRDLFEADFARSREWTEAHPTRWTDYLAEFVADQL